MTQTCNNMYSNYQGLLCPLKGISVDNLYFPYILLHLYKFRREGCCLIRCLVNCLRHLLSESVEPLLKSTHHLRYKNAKVITQIVKRTVAESQSEILPILPILSIFRPYMRQFNMNQAIDHRQYVVYWYKSSNVGHGHHVNVEGKGIWGRKTRHKLGLLDVNYVFESLRPKLP